MSDSGDATSSPGPSGLSLPASRALPVTGLSLSSPSPPGRLTSLRTRDFTLGGAFKKPKKTFEPNVHAVRKSKDELQEKINVAPRKEKKERKAVRENRGKRRERPKTIQSHSIFEQGPADSLCKAGWRGAKDLCDSNTSAVSKLVKKESKPSEEDEDEILSKLQRDHFIDDPDLRNDAHLKPIQLPLCQSSSFNSTRPENPPVFRPLEDRGGHSRSEVAKEEPPPLAELLQDLRLSGGEEFFFMQLPDCMPAKAPEQKAAPPPVGPAAQKGARKEVRPAQASQDLTKACPVLSQLPEGFLGKLQIRKSGKVELKMSDIVMDVSEGAAFSFLQQLVSVRLSDGKTGDMMVLGNVHQKLVLSPDFHTLLSHAPTEQQTEPR